MRKNILLVITSLLFFVQNKTIAQTACGWKQGDMFTRTQTDWDITHSWYNGYDQVYSSTFGIMEVGIPGTGGYSLRFLGGSDVTNFLVQSGSPAPLNADLVSTTSSASRGFGGEMVALRLNIDFSDFNIAPYTSSYKFGDLILYNLENSTLDAPELNGKSVREIISICNIWLGGGTSISNIITLTDLIASLNYAFSGGIPSQFAQDHLKKGWQQGDLYSLGQGDWDDLNNWYWYPAYGDIYSPTGIIEVGIPGSTGFSIRFTGADRINDFLIQTGTPAILNADLIDPTSSVSRSFGGEVLALRMNVDFSDFNKLPISTNYQFGDLILYDITSAPEFNGMSVRNLLSISQTLLGGGSASVPFSEFLVELIIRVNAAFTQGTPTIWAQLHLKKGWQQGDMFTRTQVDWDETNSWFPDYDAIYLPTGGIIEVGVPGTAGYSLRFTGPDVVSEFFVQTGNPAPLNADLIDPTSSSSRTLGGDALALKLNIDFSDAGKLNGNSDLLFGDLILYDLTELPNLNGKSIREILSIVNNVLGGADNATSIIDITQLLLRINGLFVSGTPSQFAQLHLKKGWQQGDMFTRTQVAWDQLPNSFDDDYKDVYASTGEVMEVGIPGTSGFSLRFSGGDRVQQFLIQTGIPAALDADALDGTSTASNQFGGEVTALRLNIDFSDSGLLAGNVAVPFGDLILYDLGSLNLYPAPELNGMSVREIIDIANFLLGGGSSSLDIFTVNNIVAELNTAFLDGTPSLFAIHHLISPCEAANSNHCPVATAASVTTRVDSAINIQLQATDEDNNTLTYGISQNPSHGTVTTSASGAAIYTPTAGYYGSDQFMFKANDGACDDEETVSVTIVVCPKKKGDWKNNTVSWPSSAIPMLLGTVSYTQAQLITILNTPVGTGPKADASLILAHQLIPAKLSIANGTVAPAEILDAITSANTLIGSNTIPMKVRPNTPLGQSLIAIATILEQFNNGALTEGCEPLPPVTSTRQVNATGETVADATNEFVIKTFPNPSTNSFSIQVNAKTNERITMQVIDMYGRMIETRNINANSNTRFGDRYRPGNYFVRILQGKEHKEIKLVKLPD